MFNNLASAEALKARIFAWLGAGVTLPPGVTFDFTTARGIGNFFLAYSGLTASNLKNIIREQIGAGNYAAIEKIAEATASLDSNPTDMIGFLDELPAKLGSDFSDLLNGFTWQSLSDQLMAAASRQIVTMAIQIAPRFLAKFDPTAGLLVSIYDGLSFVLNNQVELGQILTTFVNGLGDLAASINNPGSDQGQASLNVFKNAIVNLVQDQGLNLLLNFAAQQLGLGGIRTSVQRVISFIPNTVNELMRRLVGTVANRVMSLPPFNATGPLYAGMIGVKQPFTYENQSYNLWVAKPRTGPLQIKIGKGNDLVAVLTENFVDVRLSSGARARRTAIITAAQAIVSATSATQANGLRAALAAAEQLFIQTDIPLNACTVLNAGCFAAGTKLWTPLGYRAIEEIRPGEPIYSRNEFDPSGPIEVKMVEETFTRFAPVLHLHVGGEIIRATGEHPFFAYEKCWTKAALLQIGDRLLTAEGQWVAVEDLLDTGDWEPVYNLRVADFHTYFVGDQGWGFSVWCITPTTPSKRPLTKPSPRPGRFEEA